MNYKDMPYQEKNRFRVENDKDANYYFNNGFSEYDSLHADTVISYWIIFSTLLKFKCNYSVTKTISDLEKVIDILSSDKKDKKTIEIQQAVRLLEEFAQIYYTKGNFMLLPKGKRMMNPERYKYTQDRIDWTLYECFPGGKLSQYFKSEEDLINWIKIENLNTLFDGEIKKENIQWFTGARDFTKISQMNEPQMMEYINKSIDFIKERNNILL